MRSRTSLGWYVPKTTFLWTPAGRQGGWPVADTHCSTTCPYLWAADRQDVGNKDRWPAHTGGRSCWDGVGGLLQGLGGAPYDMSAVLAGIPPNELFPCEMPVLVLHAHAKLHEYLRNPGNGRSRKKDPHAQFSAAHGHRPGAETQLSNGACPNASPRQKNRGDFAQQPWRSLCTMSVVYHAAAISYELLRTC